MALTICRGLGLRFRCLASGLAIALTACEPDAAQHASERDAGSIPSGSSDTSSIPADNGRPALCARDRSDLVRDLICSDDPPPIRGLADLQQRLQLDPDAEEGASLLAMYGVSRFFVTLGHSTALSGHLVSPLNPRIVVLGDNLLMAFQRGVQKVELIVQARLAGTFNFYLFQFEQACNDTPSGCTPGDLYSPRVESDWLRVRVQDDEDLKNTPNDCRQCHQRGRSEPGLLMRELNNPWTHFFQPPAQPAGEFVGPGVQGNDLLQDYMKAKGDEPYGGYDVQMIAGIAPFILESTVGTDQPVLFDAPGIENERWPYDSKAGYPKHAGESPTWTAAYEAFKRGEQLAMPYLEPRVTDPEKYKRLSEAYARYRAGKLSGAELPDLADVFPDDPLVRAKIGLQTEPGASAEEALIQACGSCHNDVLDQEISRARFNVNLWKLDAAEIRLALERIELPSDARGSMPPPEARQLDASARQSLLDYLRDDPLAKDPDPRLQHAAEMGMAGGARRRATPRR